MLGDAVNSGDRAGLAILHALAVLLDDPLDRIARAGIMRLRSAGIGDRRWAESLGRYAFRGGWSAADELGDQELVVAEFEAEESGTRHAITIMVDANFDGLVRQASVASDAAAVQRAWESAPEAIHMLIVERTAQEIADRLGSALDIYDRSLDPPCDDEVPQLAALLRARLRLLPVARERERREVGQAERDSLLAGFAGSKEAGRSTVARDLARYFVDYKADFADGDPLRWSPIAVELCLLDWFPRKITMDRTTRRRVPDALRRWVRFCGDAEAASH